MAQNALLRQPEQRVGSQGRKGLGGGSGHCVSAFAAPPKVPPGSACSAASNWPLQPHPAISYPALSCPLAFNRLLFLNSLGFSLRNISSWKSSSLARKHHPTPPPTPPRCVRPCALYFSVLSTLHIRSSVAGCLCGCLPRQAVGSVREGDGQLVHHHVVSTVPGT